MDNKRLMDEIEKLVIAGVLKATKGNKQKTAESLGLYRPQLYGKLKKYGLFEVKSKATSTPASDTPIQIKINRIARQRTGGDV